MIYHVLKPLIRVLLGVYFKRIVVTGREHVPVRGPVIIVANHPNTFIDPLIVASVMERRIGFLGNAGIFSNRFLARVLRYFHVIPIFRKKDVRPGDTPDNNASFRMCHEYLTEGNTLLIFPEGSSYYELRLREIRTGTARIALSYEALMKFTGDLTILPVALDYSDSIQFRSMVSVTISQPIPVKDFARGYEVDEIRSVRKLTEAIKDALARHIPHTEGKEEEDLLVKVHKFYTTYEEPGADIYKDARRSLLVRAQLSKAMRRIQRDNLPLYNVTAEKVHDFFLTLRAHNLTVGFFTDKFGHRSRALILAGYVAVFLMLLPVYLVGLCANYVPYMLPAKIFKMLRLDIEYKASVQMFAGLVTFPLFYWIIFALLKAYVIAETPMQWLVFPLFAVCGFAAMYYWTEIRRFRRVVHFYFQMKPQEKAEVLRLRDEILQCIIKAKAALG